MDRNEKDQAEQLRKIVNQPKTAMQEEEIEEEKEYDQLPPRSEVHGDKEKKTKWKVKYPLVRFLALVFILLVFLIPGYALWSKSQPATTDEDYTESVQLQEDSSDAANDDFDLPGEEKDGQAEQGKSSFVSLKPEEGVQEALADEKQQDSQASNNIKPDKPEQPKPKPEPEPEPKPTPPPAKPEYTTYVVKAEDNLFRISLKFYGGRSGEEIIKRANNLNADGTVFEGQKLIIPK